MKSKDLRKRLMEARMVERDMRYTQDIDTLENLIADYRDLKQDTFRLVQHLRSKGEVGSAVYEALTEGGDSFFDLLGQAVDGKGVSTFSLVDALETLTEGETGGQRLAMDSKIHLCSDMSMTHPRKAFEDALVSQRVAERHVAALPPEFLEHQKGKKDDDDDDDKGQDKEAGLPPEFLEQQKKMKEKSDGESDDKDDKEQSKEASERLRRVASVLAKHGQRGLATEVAQISLAIKSYGR